MVHFILHVTKPDARANKTLSALAPLLDREELAPDDHGRVSLLIDDMTGSEAYAMVTQRLGEIDPDWNEYLHIRQPA